MKVTLLRTLFSFAAGSLIFAGNSLAANIDYSLTSGTVSISFAVPQNPTPNPASPAAFDVNPASVTINGTTYNDGILEFFTTAGGGGAEIIGGVTDLVLTGQPLFTGTTAAPTLEAFSGLQLTNAGGGPVGAGEFYTVNATSGTAAAPEPTTLFLLAGGLAPLFLKRKLIFSS